MFNSKSSYPFFLSILAYFIFSFAENIIISNEETPLMKAAARGDINVMKRLIKKGAEVNAVAYREQPHGGKPVLRYAIDSGCLEAVRILLQAGANPNDFTESKLLYKKGTHKTNMRNLSLLSHAVHVSAPISIIKELIAKGADVDGSPKIAGDWTPLMIAAYKGNKEAVKILLQAGANPRAINKMDNKTALDYAKEGNSINHKEIVKILETASSI